MNASPVPTGYTTITPYFLVVGVSKFIEYLQEAYDGEAVEAIKGPDGAIRHAEVKVADQIIMMGEAGDASRAMPITLYFYLADCDQAYQKALNAGATSVQEPSDQFYGDRTGAVKDPFGNKWYFATRKETLTQEELQQRANRDTQE